MGANGVRGQRDKSEDLLRTEEEKIRAGMVAS